MTFRVGDLVRGNQYRPFHDAYKTGWRIGTYESVSPIHGSVSYILVEGKRQAVFTDTLTLEKPALDLTKPVQTCTGKPVRLLCIDGPNKKYPVIGTVDGVDFPYYWSADGQVCYGTGHFPLVQTPPPKATKTVHVKLFRNKTRGGVGWNMSTKAEGGIPNGCKLIARKEITIIEGEGMCQEPDCSDHKKPCNCCH